MARVDLATYKASLDTAAAAMTTAMQDDTVTELAPENKPNHSPARDPENWFILNKDTGVYTTNEAYADAFYAGAYPSAGTLVDGQGVRTAPTLVTATLETAAPLNIVLTFDAPIYDSSSVAIGGAASAGKSIVGITYAGAVVTITVSAAYIAADVVTVTGTFNGAAVAITLTAQAVTNNIV